MSDSSYKLFVASTLIINNESISQKETLQHTITLRGANKSKDMTLNESDVSLLQIIQSLQNENDCISVANTPPRMVMLKAGVINTSFNEARIKIKVENDWVVTNVSPSAPLEMVGYDGHLKGYFCSEVVSI